MACSPSQPACQPRRPEPVHCDIAESDTLTLKRSAAPTAGFAAGKTLTVANEPNWRSSSAVEGGV